MGVLKNINSIKMKFLFSILAIAQVNCQTLMDTPPEMLAMMIMDPTTHEAYMAMESADQVFNMETGEILDSFMNPVVEEEVVEEVVEEEDDGDDEEVCHQGGLSDECVSEECAGAQDALTNPEATDEETIANEANCMDVCMDWIFGPGDEEICMWENEGCHEGPYTGVGNCVKESCAEAQDALWESG